MTLFQGLLIGRYSVRRIKPFEQAEAAWEMAFLRVKGKDAEQPRVDRNGKNRKKIGRKGQAPVHQGIFNQQYSHAIKTV
jgi:hypothetical protein